MNNKQYNFVMAVLGAFVFFLGNAVSPANYQMGVNFTIMSVPIILVAIWFELRKED